MTRSIHIRQSSLINQLLLLSSTFQPYLYFISVKITVAAIVSKNAYKAWEDNPILTTVSTTAYPIHKLEYPAITICGQGMATDTLDRVLKQRFDVWLKKRNIDVDCKVYTEQFNK